MGGLLALEKSKIENHTELVLGEYVDFFITPAGKFILRKSETGGRKIANITPGYICFEKEI